MIPVSENENLENIPEMEEETVQQPPKKKKKILGKIIYFVLLAAFIAVFVYCAYYIANYAVGSKQSSDSFASLSDIVSSLRDKNANEDTSGGTLPSGISGGENADTSYMLPEYLEIYEMNNDLVGWISFPDLDIDYPVMQTPDRDNYYLKRDFNGKYSKWGCIYVREECDVFRPSDNVVIYGHHMRDGSMFAGLDAYKKKDYWEEHQYFTFDTLYEHHTYQIIAVFKTSANLGQGFAYHIFNTADSEEEFEEFIETVHDLQMYDTGLTAQYGDLLLTLSTCEYTLDNGRFVVIAKRVS